MKNAAPLKFFLVGEDSLLIDCAKILLSRKWQCLGIISPLDTIQEWATEKNIPCFKTIEKAKPTLLKKEFDYLFSIINSQILPDDIISLPRFLSINFHTALLPQYAGLFPTSWAILNNEKTHGVTWHIMNSQIDGGGILKQEKINIEKNDTAFSLSMKCYQIGVKLFTKLIPELEQSAYQISPQNLELRSYYSVFHKPPGNGWINWNSSAEIIVQTYKALELGHYINQLSLTKFKISGDAFTIKNCSITAEKSKHFPGTLVNLDENNWQISTKTYDLLIFEILTIEGVPCSLAEVAKKHNLKLGVRLNSPTDNDLKEFEKISSTLSKFEYFWVKQLRCFKPALLPFLKAPNSILKNKKYITVHTLFVPIDIYEEAKNAFSEVEFYQIVLAIWLVYLYKLGNKETLGIFLYHPKLKCIDENINDFFSETLPFLVDLDGKTTFWEAVSLVNTHYLSIVENISYLKDIQQRYPDLRNYIHASQIGIFITDDPIEKIERLLNTDVAMIINTNGRKITWLVNEEVLMRRYVKQIVDNIPQHFSILLKSLVDNKKNKIDQISLLTEKECQSILFDWNKTTTSYPSEKTITEIFQEQVKETPDHKAVISNSQSLTYKELNEKSNKLANFLLKNKCGKNSLIAVLADHDLSLAVNLLAILKIGASYIPIDPMSGIEHIKNILADCKPEVILVKKKYTKVIKKITTSKIISPDGVAHDIENEDFQNLVCPFDSSQLAYIIYTSGTTGKPKGVMVTHKGIIRLVKNTNYISIKSFDKVAQAANISFDAATFEIWGALLNGATLIEVSKDSLLNPIKFSRFLKNKKISILFLTAPLFHEHVSNMPEMFSNLTYLLVGGDVVKPEKVQKLIQCEAGSPKYILNGYGPTENTTFTTTYLMSENNLYSDSIPIGKPISNTTAYILDEHLLPTPLGVPGQLFTGGDGVAIGYLNNVELTNEKFINNPFLENGNDRLYKTGDIARWTPEGTIDYLGRIDKQVKIRGHRVELEGIEKIVLKNGNILQCVVIEAKEKNQENYLIAYLVKDKSVGNNVLSEIKRELSKTLPDYMIPRFFLIVNKIPLTLNGKIDFKKLPLPDKDKREYQSQYVPPSSEIEQKLCTIWAKLFFLKKVSVLDDFFDLGGHSLLLTKLILDVKRMFNFDLNIHEFLKFPTIAYLARIIYNKSDLKIDELSKKIIADDISWNKYNIRKHSQHSNKNGGAILITGCTGFLGAYLLASLSREYEGDIYCLIRASSMDQAVVRLNQTIKKYDLNLRLKNRIKPLFGDISLPCLGLSSETYSILTEKIDAIYHNAAHVNHIYGYEILRQENVLSTIEVIKLATLNRIKKICYISTLSAVVEYISEEEVIEDFIPDFSNSSHLLDGYNQTKWASEKILAVAHLKGIAVKIFRPGWILGDTQTGRVSSEKNHLLLLLKGCIQMKAAPDWEMELNILPVDFLAESIIKISLESDIKKNVFNFSNNHSITWKELILFLNNNGFPISIVDSSEWRSKYLAEIDENNALFNLLSLHMNPNIEWNEGLSGISKVCDNNTRVAFKKLNLAYPNIDNNLLKKYIDYLIKTRFIQNGKEN